MTAEARVAVPMIDLRAQYAAIESEVRAAFDRILAAQQFVLGPELAELEREIASYCDSRFAVGVASGTDALVLALRACGVKAGDEVIVPAFTFIATAGAVSALGARPVFADVQPGTLMLDPQSAATRVTRRTKAMIVVHLYGSCADIGPLAELAAQHRLPLVEDNAQSLGATWQGHKAGSFGAASATSFYPSKNLGAFGDAGMVVTNSEETATRIARLRNHGQTGSYVSGETGWNSRLDELQAAVLRIKLRHLDGWIAARRKIAGRYDRAFASQPGMAPVELPAGCAHTYYLYTVRVPGGQTNPAEHRDRVRARLAEQGIATGVYYPLPLHLQPAYAVLGGKPGDLPVAERAAHEVLSLPLYPEMTAKRADRVIYAVTEALRR